VDGSTVPGVPALGGGHADQWVSSQAFAQADQGVAEPVPQAPMGRPGHPAAAGGLTELPFVLLVQSLHLRGMDHAFTVRLNADIFGP
jgi:hypothetical protein